MIRFDGAVLRNGGFSLRADLTVLGPGICAIVGPSGAGKSTLLLALAGFASIGAGRLMIGEQDVTALPPAQRPVSVLFQDHNLFAHLDVAANVSLGLRPDLRLNAAQKSRVQQVLQHTGLQGLSARKPAMLSGGQQQRVAIARALLRDRPVLLLDEAFGALGPGLRREMLTLVRTVAVEQNLTVLMVTHEPEDARAIADHVLFVAQGQVHPPLPTAEFFAAPPRAVADYLGLD
ncbi:thiamine transport system ATP-binding protein [Monaibacterium marinum]|uniref:Thiamine transport system ATP-binding protein n=1 Tax=Pontivivens marinum TaxID=1690039 RepID=A0A2C9CV60_9RHOB|nr:thiamine ABC transporter ATP-binding protein [Monaibacterium marinum]SOH94299.1 thiamine transport system ATP-binding protein [Monaibacterium marinum]